MHGRSILKMNWIRAVLDLKDKMRFISVRSRRENLIFHMRHEALGTILGTGAENNGHNERYKRNNGP